MKLDELEQLAHCLAEGILQGGGNSKFVYNAVS